MEKTSTHKSTEMSIQKLNSEIIRLLRKELKSENSTEISRKLGEIDQYVSNQVTRRTKITIGFVWAVCCASNIDLHAILPAMEEIDGKMYIKGDNVYKNEYDVVELSMLRRENQFLKSEIEQKNDQIRTKDQQINKLLNN